MNNKRKWFLYTAIVGLIFAVALIILNSSQRSTSVDEMNQTRLSVDASISRLVPAAVAGPDDPALLSAVDKLDQEPYVAAVWLVDTGGEILVHDGGPGKAGSSVRDWGVQNEADAYLSALQPGTLSTGQELQLLAVGAMRSEGEHNDVFRHMAVPVAGVNGQTQAFIVVAHDASPKLASPDAGYIAVLFSLLICLAIYWLGLPLWTYYDARARGESALLWGGFVLITNFIGLIAYLIVVSKPPAGSRTSPTHPTV